MSDSLACLKDALSDRYTIERELGAGGMATDVLPCAEAPARHHRMNAPVRVLKDAFFVVVLRSDQQRRGGREISGPRR